MNKGFPTKHGLYKAASNAEIQFVFKPIDNKQYSLPGVHFSFSADPTVGTALTVEVLDPEAGSTWRVIHKSYIKSGGPGPYEFVRPYETPNNTGVRVTLDAGGSGVLSTLELVGFQAQ
jgi:hypothetical protein